MNCAYDTTNCTGACQDLDGDTFTDALCGGLDCNDSDPSIHPGATEVCNGVDDNCDGQVDEGGVCSVCGNGNVDTGEQCDGADLNGASLRDAGLHGRLSGSVT